MFEAQSKKNWKVNLAWILAAALLSLLMIWVSRQAQSPATHAVSFGHGHIDIARGDGSKAGFTVEVATTQPQQEHGLMFRENLPAATGMLFLWSEDQPISMWMKDTLIPLDMLFVTHDGRISKIIANAVPRDLTPLSSDGVVRAVIEIGGGEAARQNIHVGDRVLYPAFAVAP